MENKQRQIAYKIRVLDILNGKYVKEEGWAPNYIIARESNVSRVNLMGVIIAKTDDKENTEILIDDKTGKISVRAFDGYSIFNGVGVGDFVLIIDRPREYNTKKYIVPEIIKKINKSWFKLRVVELCGPEGKTIKQKKERGESKKSSVLNKVIKNKINSEEVLGLIKGWDTGAGADYALLIEKIGDEKVIKELLEEGEIFEVTPGKLKVL